MTYFSLFESVICRFLLNDMCAYDLDFIQELYLFAFRRRTQAMGVIIKV